MYLFELISEEPLETFDNTKYQSFAGDGESLLFLDQSGPRIVRHCLQLNYLEEHSVSRAYTGICYDDTEKCYWGCTGKSNNLIYKLTDTFREMDRFQLCGYDACFGTVKSIAHDRQEDCLLITFSNRVVAVDKQAFCLKTIHCCVCPQVFQGCIRSGQHHYYISRHCNGEMLTITKGSQAIIHCCLPVGHRILAMTETCGCHGPVIHFLSVKHGTYFYVLRGVLVCSERTDIDSPSFCPCAEGPETEEFVEHHCTCGNCHSSWGQERHPYSICRHQGGCCHHHDRFIGENRLDSSASVIESIALEQTAISHILNAEGEKIQKVVAVSDQPSDFLDVNQSVLEMITKITHLEQVLFSKLDLACGVLRERTTQDSRGE